jgi:peptide/nickel transport system substrate-binding protein
MRKISIIVFSLLAMGSLLMAACQPAATETAVVPTSPEQPTTAAATETPAGPTEAEKTGGTFTYGAGAVVQFDPPFINDDPSFHVASLVHVFLFRSILGEDGITMTTIPELASSWELQEGGKVVLFHLNQGWTFQDGNDVFLEGQGREITADDVVYSIDRMVNIEGTKSPSDLISAYDSAEAVDKYTVKLNLKEPDAVLFATGRGLTSTAILPKEAVDQLGENWGLNPIGGGPFEFVEYVPDDHVTLQRNEDYAITPYLDQVVFKIIPDQDVQVISLEAGEVDDIGSLPAQEFDRFENDPNYKLYKTNCPFSFNLQFDFKDPVFQDINVREAIAHAVDGRAIMQNQYGGQWVEGCGIAGPGIPGYDPDLCDKYFTYDTAKSEQLMTDAGWTKNSDGIWEKDGQPLSFVFEVWNTTPAPTIATAAVTQMKEAGFDAQLTEVEFGTWIEDALGENTQKPMMMWSGFCGEGGMNSYWGRSGLSRGWGFDNEEVFTMLDQANVIVDPTERQNLLQTAQDMIYGSYADVPLGFATNYEIGTARVEDYIVTMWFDNLVTASNNVWFSSK